VKCTWSNVSLQEVSHYELLSVFLQLRYNGLTSPPIVYNGV
jgi:hypothetical protein